MKLLDRLKRLRYLARMLWQAGRFRMTIFLHKIKR